MLILGIKRPSASILLNQITTGRLLHCGKKIKPHDYRDIKVRAYIERVKNTEGW